MQIRNLAIASLMVISFQSWATGFEPSKTDGEQKNVTSVENASLVEKPVERVDTFAKLVELYGQAAAAKIGAEIRVNQSAGNGSRQAESPPVNANPLMNANQALLNSEPTLEAIWGMEGREVAEINYKGQRYAISRLHPMISESDGWELEDIKPMRIVLVKKKGAKTIKKKDITLNWQGNINGVIDISNKPFGSSGIGNVPPSVSQISAGVPFVMPNRSAYPVGSSPTSIAK